MKMSVAIPYHGDRLKWTMAMVSAIHSYAFIQEIVICIDPSNVSYEQLKKVVRHYKKVKLFFNDKRLFVFRNKIKAVSLCTGEWVALIDSDNVAGHAFFGPIARKEFDKNVILAPQIGRPMLHYEQYTGEDINMKCAARHIKEKEDAFMMLLNTMNYVFHRETWLNALNEAIESDYEPITADSIYMNYHCMKNGMVIRIVDKMLYNHTIHAGSTYARYPEDGRRESKKIENLILESANEDAGATDKIYTERQEGISIDSNWSATGNDGSTVVRSKSGYKPESLLSD